jgi:hypothetical protein
MMRHLSHEAAGSQFWPAAYDFATSALDQKRTSHHVCLMSALPLNADISWVSGKSASAFLGAMRPQQKYPIHSTTLQDALSTSWILGCEALSIW